MKKKTKKLKKKKKLKKSQHFVSKNFRTLEITMDPPTHPSNDRENSNTIIK